MASVGEKVPLTQFLKLLSTSVPTKLLCLGIIVSYFVTFRPEMSLYLTCVPFYVQLPYLRVWTLITASFVETRILFVVIDIFCILSSAVILEPLWGVSELFIFLATISSVTTLLNVSFCFLVSAISPLSRATMNEIFGASGVLCGLAVSLKQVRPDFELSLVPPVSFRLKHLPFLCILLYLLLGAFDLIPFFSVVTAVTSLVVSWSYLRFLQRRESDTRGDPADAFEFITLFPEALHPCMNKIGYAMASFLRALRLYPASQHTYDLGVPSEIGLLLPVTAASSTDRRKLKAQKDLEERLSRTVGRNEEEWPDLLETDSVSPGGQGELESVVVSGEIKPETN